MSREVESPFDLCPVWTPGSVVKLNSDFWVCSYDHLARVQDEIMAAQ